MGHGIERGRGSESLEGYALKTTPPLKFAQCQNFENSGKRGKPHSVCVRSGSGFSIIYVIWEEGKKI